MVHDPASGALERNVLERRGIGEIGDQTETRFTNPRPNAVDEGELPDRRDGRLFINQLLDFSECLAALLRVELDRLLLEQLIDVGIAAVRIGAAPDDERREPRRRVAEGAAAALDDVL